jgi:hypothetical protein
MPIAMIIDFSNAAGEIINSPRWIRIWYNGRMKTTYLNNLCHQSNLPRILAICLLALLALIFAGCKSAPNNPVGNYALFSVDSKPMPAEIAHEGAKIRVLSGSLAFTPDGECTSTTVFNVEGHGEANRVVKASWKRAASAIEMTWHGAGMTVGTLAGDTFTMNNEGMIFLYRK